MIELYAMGSPNVVKVFIALEELRLPYNTHIVDVFAGKQFDPGFVRLNPNAKVPVIIDSEGPGGKPITIFESGAILIYLAEKAGQLLPKDGAARYESLKWLMVQLTGQGPMSGQLVHFVRFAPPGNDYPHARYKTQVRNVYKALDARLGECRYLGGDAYTLADIATFPWTRIAETVSKGITADLPHLKRWLDEMAARPAVQRAVAAAEATRSKMSTYDKVSADQLDRFLQRGRYGV
jgi:GST-like protein